MKFLKINQIKPNPNQPRKLIDEESLQELADSIKTDGLFNPITVRPLGKDKYQIVHGERRYGAAKKIGLKRIEVKVIKISDDKAFLFALIENLQRKDISAYEEMEAFKELQKKGFTQKAIAKRIGKTQSYVAQKLRLSQLPITVSSMIMTGGLTEGGARQILKIKGIINKYNCNKCDHHTFKDWVSFYQDQIAWGSVNEPVSVIKEKVENFRFNFVHAEMTTMPTREDKERWFKTGIYQPHKIIKGRVNPVLKKEYMVDELEWGLKYAHEHGLDEDPEEYVT